VNEKPANRIDFAGLLEWFGLLKLTQVFRQMQPSESLEILGADAAVRGDIFRVLPRGAYRVVHMEPFSEGGDGGRIVIQKQRQAT
jgi:TusA-related sulfurtransferase